MFLVIGALNLSIGISFLALVIRELVNISNKEENYNKKLNQLLKKLQKMVNM